MEEAPVSVSPPPGTSSADRGRILIADDSPVNAQFLRIPLQKAGFEVSLARNGREAVALFEKGGIDLILMDVQMPEMDGLRATRLIRAREKVTGGRVPIVAVTGSNQQDERQRCSFAGMDGYLPKSAHGPELFETIARLLKKPAQGGAGQSMDNSPSSEAPQPWLDALQGMDDDPEAIARLVQTFVTTIPERLLALENAIERGDGKQVMQFAHALKGSLLVFAAREASALAGQLEHSAHAEPTRDPARVAAELRGQVEALLQSMHGYLQSQAKSS